MTCVLRERDRRIAETPFVGDLWRRGFYFAPGSWEKALRFVADVWAADMIVKEIWGADGAKPARVADWLKEHGGDHGYTDASLRKMIHKARRRVEVLEKTGAHGDDLPIWPLWTPPMGHCKTN